MLAAQLERPARAQLPLLLLLSLQHLQQLLLQKEQGAGLLLLRWYPPWLLLLLLLLLLLEPPDEALQVVVKDLQVVALQVELLLLGLLQSHLGAQRLHQEGLARRCSGKLHMALVAWLLFLMRMTRHLTPMRMSHACQMTMSHVGHQIMRHLMTWCHHCHCRQWMPDLACRLVAEPLWGLRSLQEQCCLAQLQPGALPPETWSERQPGLFFCLAVQDLLDLLVHVGACDCLLLADWTACPLALLGQAPPWLLLLVVAPVKHECDLLVSAGRVGLLPACVAGQQEAHSWRLASSASVCAQCSVLLLLLLLLLLQHGHEDGHWAQLRALLNAPVPLPLPQPGSPVWRCVFGLSA